MLHPVGRRPRIPASLATLMERADRHAWTLEELRSALAEGGAEADFSSVFRAMGRLEADGVVRRVELDDGRARFELDADHHGHLRCEGCGEVSPVPCRAVDATLTELEAATGFAITGHRLVLDGVCPGCRRARAAVRPAPAASGVIQDGGPGPAGGRP